MVIDVMASHSRGHMTVAISRMFFLKSLFKVLHKVCLTNHDSELLLTILYMRCTLDHKV